MDSAGLAMHIKSLAREMGFQRCGITGIELGEDEAHLHDWLAQGLYGSMDWMARYGDKRARPRELIPGTVRVISVGLDYGRNPDEAWETLEDGARAYVARYALGRGYRKRMHNRLRRLADRVAAPVGRSGTASLSTQRSAGTCACTQRRPRLDRQAHLPDRQGRRHVTGAGVCFPRTQP